MAGIEFSFPIEYMKAALVLALLTVLLLVGVFSYLNLYTRRRYFSMWTAAWLFYSLWLTLRAASEGLGSSPLLRMFEQWAISASAIFLLWGGSLFHGIRSRQTLFGWFLAFLMAWSYVDTHHLESGAFTGEACLFGLIGLASAVTAWAFFRFRARRGFVGAGLLGFGFALWAINLGTHPFVQLSHEYAGTAFLISSVLQLFIAISMIVLVLEEVRNSRRIALRFLRSKKHERAALRHQVASTEERYQKLFQQAHEGIVIVDAAELKILEINTAGASLLGLDRSATLSRNLNRFITAVDTSSPAPEDGAAWFRWVQANPHVQMVRPDGRQTLVEIYGSGVELSGKPAFQFFLREVTERVRMEQQLQEAERLSALGRMINGVSHELNNPLAVMMGYLELILQRHDLNETTRIELEKVARENQRMATLVRNFLAFARTQSVRREGVNLNDQLTALVTSREAEARAIGVEVTLDLDPVLPTTEADPAQVRQVFANLLTNALQAVLDRPSPGRVVIRSEACGSLLRISVEDNGPGISREVQARMFEPFFTTRGVGVGTGLGLSTAHGIIAEHGGTITYQPSALGGACFVVELPLIQPQRNLHPHQEMDTQFHFNPKAIAAAAPQPPTEKPQATRVLVLDDEEAIGDLLKEMLNMLGYDTSVFNRGQDALAALEQREFDVVLSDYRMPGMDGKAFYRKAAERHPELAHRFVFLTGDTVNDETLSFVNEIGAHCIGKPFHLHTVEQAVNRAKAGEPAAEPFAN